MHGIDVLLQPIGELVEDAEDLAGDMIQFALSKRGDQNVEPKKDAPGTIEMGRNELGKWLKMEPKDRYLLLAY
ncbi:hypothetical protein L596_006972 [Steinernema carpocapsae]|uniref:Uncharacterized protein n=1 Tax=Steinernema carpocapsae TaxID=34508 RepID=A0A4U5P7S1_STECR|nr:hypothetical protein L596_006972 [Steinernema carpocapsae]